MCTDFQIHSANFADFLPNNVVTRKLHIYKKYQQGKFNFDSVLNFVDFLRNSVIM